MEKFCDGVFEGGGVRGIGLAGAVAAVSEAGYSFKRVAGTSAGAIVAALIAAGYNADEIKYEINNLNLNLFKDKSTKFGHVGMLFSLGSELGLYQTRYFENWLSGLLDAKNVKTFSDLKIPLKVTATDITDSKLLILPDDLQKFGLNPEEFSVTTAVRMSIGIPLFFKPFILEDSNGKKHYIADGGLISNYPIWLYDNKSRPDYPVFGFRFDNMPRNTKKDDGKIGLVDYIKSIISCIIDTSDDEYILYAIGNAERAISISTTVEIDGAKKAIESIYFDISKQESEALYQNGYAAGKKFIENFEL